MLEALSGKNATLIFSMQEKKNKRLFILLLILIGVTLTFAWMGQRKRTPDIDKNIFKIPALERADKVLLESSAGKVELSFNGTRWRVNNRYDADRQLVTVLMATLREAEPRRPLTGSFKDSLSTSIEQSGIKVSLFSGANLLRTFFAGGNHTKTQSYFKDPQTGDIYLMAIPGYRVYVSGILELDENGWRDKYVFGFNGRNFLGLKAEFPQKPSENFKVSQIQQLFVVEGLPKTDTAKLYTYLDDVLSLTADEYLQPSALTDSLLRVQPRAVITVTDMANRNYVLKLYYPLRNSIPAIFNEDQAIIFNQRKIRPLLRPKSFFVLK